MENSEESIAIEVHTCPWREDSCERIPQNTSNQSSVADAIRNQNNQTKSAQLMLPLLLWWWLLTKPLEHVETLLLQT
jgi:hypothetical protein